MSVEDRSKQTVTVIRLRSQIVSSSRFVSEFKLA